MLRRIEQRFGHLFTDFERGFADKEQRVTRWSNSLTWNSLGMRDAELLVKSDECWQILPACREAIDEFPDGAGLKDLTDSAYRAMRASSDAPSTSDLLEAALDVLEPGKWTSYTELARAVGTNAQTVGSYIRETRHGAAFRVLRSNGLSSRQFTWVEPRDVSQHEALESEGIDFSAGSAAPSQMLHEDDFRAYLDSAGLLDARPELASVTKTESLARRHPEAADAEGLLPEATDEFARRLHVDAAWIQEVIDLLRDRPQLIFYGPPGTGKT